MGDPPLTDRLTETISLALVQLLRLELEAAGKDPKQRAAALETIRELARLREGDHAMMRLRLQSDRWEIEEQRMRDEDRKRDIQEMKDHLTGRVCSAISRPTLAKALGGGKAAGKLADLLHKIQYETFSPNGTGDGPGRVNSGSSANSIKPNDPTGSNSIKPNQTGNIQESARNGPDPTESE